MKRLRAGTETGSLMNHLMSGSEGPAPEVGMGATVLHWTDRSACTVEYVSPDKRELWVRYDTAIRTDSHGMSDSQSYRYEPNPQGILRAFFLTAEGWREGRTRRGRGKGGALLLGVRQHYHDYSF